MRRYLLLLSLATLGCHAQQPTPQVFSANVIIPNPAPSAQRRDWTDSGNHTKVSFDANSTTLRGFRYAGTDSSLPAILFFNGNGMSVLGSDSLYRNLAALGPTVYAYDYPGYGFSDGKADVGLFREDGLKLYDALSASQHVVVFGYSLGTVTASYISSQRKVTGLILAAAIATAEEEFPVYARRAMGMSDAEIAVGKPSPEAHDYFNEAFLATKSQAPFLELHGDADVLVPIAQGREIFAASSGTPKKFVVVPGAGHNHTLSGPVPMGAIHDFLRSLR